ncbi:hypothetical protein EBZ39_06970 [bacterium]|nr:hypothetical protein [bacterium]
MPLVINTSRLQAALRAFQGFTRQEAEKEMRTQARVLAMRLMENTQPSPTIRRRDSGAPLKLKQKRSFNDNLQASAESKVASDISKVYKSVGEAVGRIRFGAIPKGRTASQTREQAARAFAGMLKGKTYKKRDPAVTQAESLLQRLNVFPLIQTKIGNFDGGSAHQRARFGPKQRVPRNQHVRTIVINPQELDKYTEQRMTRAGVVKAAWAECAQKLGGLGDVRSGGANAVPLPSWVRRHVGKYSKGSVNEALSGDKPYIEMKNGVSYVGENITPQTIQETVDFQVKRLVSRLGYIAAAAAKKAGFSK